MAKVVYMPPELIGRDGIPAPSPIVPALPTPKLKASFESPTPPKESKKGRPRKYHTEEERKAAAKEAQMRYWAKPCLERLEALETQVKEGLEALNAAVHLQNRRIDKICEILSTLYIVNANSPSKT